MGRFISVCIYICYDFNISFRLNKGFSIAACKYYSY